MKFLVTGATGFVAQNFIEKLELEHEVFKVSRSTPSSELIKYCQSCDVVYHFAACQKADNEADFWQGNVEYTNKLTRLLADADNNCPIVFSSSVHVDTQPCTKFALSKRQAEINLENFVKDRNNRLAIFRLTHTFGKFQKPNHNSFFATAVYSVVHNKEIKITDPSNTVNLMPISEVIKDVSNFINSDQKLLYKTYVNEGVELSLDEVLKLIKKLNTLDASSREILKKKDVFNSSILETIEYISKMPVASELIVNK